MSNEHRIFRFKHLHCKNCEHPRFRIRAIVEGTADLIPVGEAGDGFFELGHFLAGPEAPLPLIVTTKKEPEFLIECASCAKPERAEKYPFDLETTEDTMKAVYSDEVEIKLERITRSVPVARRTGKKGAKADPPGFRVEVSSTTPAAPAAPVTPGNVRG
jgi:hypothetical protein